MPPPYSSFMITLLFLFSLANYSIHISCNGFDHLIHHNRLWQVPFIPLSGEACTYHIVHGMHPIPQIHRTPQVILFHSRIKIQDITNNLFYFVFLPRVLKSIVRNFVWQQFWHAGARAVFFWPAGSAPPLPLLDSPSSEVHKENKHEKTLPIFSCHIRKSVRFSYAHKVILFIE